MRNLTFKELKEANTKRNITLFGPDKWIPEQYGNAIAGEVGELCNKIKKLAQGREISQEEIEEEIADIVIYADLIATKFNTTLEKCIVEKFNKKSELWKSEIKL